MADSEIAAFNDIEYDIIKCYNKCASTTDCSYFSIVDDMIWATIMCLPNCEIKFGTCKLFRSNCEHEVHTGMSFFPVEACEVPLEEDLRCFGATMFNPANSNKQLGANGCWARNVQDDVCFIANPECSKVQCTNSHMVVFVRYDMIFRTTPTTNQADSDDKLVNDVLSRFNKDRALLNCASEAEYLNDTKQFKFTFPLGNCSMEISRQLSTSPGIE